jgi:hypothetical protein
MVRGVERALVPTLGKVAQALTHPFAVTVDPILVFLAHSEVQSSVLLVKLVIELGIVVGVVVSLTAGGRRGGTERA